MAQKNVVLGVCGGIACYKSCEIVSRLKKGGCNVDVIMTKNSCEFVAPLTFETLSARPVVIDMFDRNHPWEVEHISLAKKADVFVVAPATANVIGKIANGIADDMLTTTVMATHAKVLIAPAMNTNMYENPIVQKNISTLKSLGYLFLEPVEGRLACGDVGKGKMPEPEQIVDEIYKIFAKSDEKLQKNADLSGKKVLITAGATMQPIDGVRCITNFSSGKMGCALAQEAKDRGADVSLVLGLHDCVEPCGVSIAKVTTTEEMFDSVKQRFVDSDIIIFAAAPSDYRPVEKIKNKLKGEKITLELVKNTDIAAFVGKNKSKKQISVIFAAETEDLLQNAAAKMAAKNADMVIANDVTQEGAGFNCDTNVVTVLTANSRADYPKMNKSDLAKKIFDEILGLSK